MADLENINSASELTLDQEIQQAVAQAIEPLLASTSWRTYTGPQQERLADELAKRMGIPHVGLTCSGSAALELVLRACRLPAGDEVLLSAYDYPGNFTAIENCGLRPVLVDVEPNGWNLSLTSLDDAYSSSCKALVASHLHGQLQDLAALRDWCSRRGVSLIQDACQAIGASWGGQALGHWGDATVLSFGGSKTLSAGRGGAWCTPSADLAQHIRIAAGVGSGAYQLSELQAALVLAQLPFLERITQSCRSFFRDQNARIRQSLPEVCAPWETQLAWTAFYQAGWLLPNEWLVDTPADNLHAIWPDIVFGKGFDGFHRRSSRRCRRAGELESCAQVVARTITVHHRIAITRPTAHP